MIQFINKKAWKSRFFVYLNLICLFTVKCIIITREIIIIYLNKQMINKIIIGY